MDNRDISILHKVAGTLSTVAVGTLYHIIYVSMITD